MINPIETHPCDETEHDPKTGSFENVEISHNNNTWRITGMLGFFGWDTATTFLVTAIHPVSINDPEDHESFEIALDYWMNEMGIPVAFVTVRIGEWVK
jgi:hypothetical protein